MSSKRRIRRNACKGKYRHKNKTRAVAAAISYQKDFGQHMSSYHCKFCKGWHIGHS
jgi:hypothetical protein